MTSNRLAVTGAVLVTFAVAKLAGLWWAVLLLGVLCFALAWVNHLWEQRTPTIDEQEPAPRGEIPVRRVS